MIIYQVDDNLESSLLRNSELGVPKSDSGSDYRRTWEDIISYLLYEQSFCSFEK